MSKDTSKKQNKANSSFISAKTAAELELTQINKFHTKGGTGFAAEDANALNDRLRFKKVEQVGGTNELNGPDRIVNGTPIQTKYFKSASETMNAAFGDSGYRYGNQLLEVPSDQYDECVKIMRERIGKGQVPGVSDPAEAERLVKKGRVTYTQARNIARAGTIDSLVFDAKTQAISSGYTFAISLGISYAQHKWAGESNEDALHAALSSALESSATSFVAGIITSQILRTHTAAVGVVMSRHGVKFVAQSPAGKKAIELIAKASLGKAIYGAAATNHVAKLLRTNVVTVGVVTAVQAVPDLYRALIEESISWEQFLKNTGVNLSSVAGGAGGWWAGAAAGTFFGPVGTFIGGCVGAIVAGSFSGELAKEILDDLVEDDAQKMLKIVPDGLSRLSADYMLSEDEVRELAKCANDRLDPEFLRDMFRSSDRITFVYNRFDTDCQSIVAKRPVVTLPPAEQVEQILSEIEKNVAEELDEICE